MRLGESKTSLCNPGVKQTLRPSPSRVVQSIVCEGFVDYEANGGWLLPYWDRC